MRKARIKIDRIVKSCLECPFLCEQIKVWAFKPNFFKRLYARAADYEVKTEAEYFCTASRYLRVIGSVKPGSIPDWCPFSIEEGKEDAD